MAFIGDEQNLSYAERMRQELARRHRQQGGGGQPPQAPPGPPQGSQIPGQGIYLQRQAQAEQAYQASLAQLAARKQQTFRNYGFLENGSVDPNNNFGQLQNMWRQQNQEATGEDYDLLSRGIHGGLAGQVHTAANQRVGAQNLDLQNAYTGEMTDIANDTTQAERDRNDALLAAQQEALQQAQQDDNYTPAQAPPEESPLPNRAKAKKTVAKARAKAKKAKRGRRR